jgi:hypothetical protein
MRIGPAGVNEAAKLASLTAKNYQKLGPDDKLFDTSNGHAVASNPKAVDQWVEVGRDPQTGQLIQRNARTGQMQAVGMKPSSVSVNTGQTPFAKQFGEKQADSFFDLRKSADRAVETISSIHTMRDAMDSGMMSGGGAGAKATMLNYLKPMGFEVNEDMLKNTTKFNMSVGKFMLQHAKDLGANPSNADAARIDRIIGSADTDPNAMREMMDWQEDMARRSIRRYNTQYEQIKQKPEIFNAYDMGVAEPPIYQPKKREQAAPAPKGANVDGLVDHYLKRKPR